MSAAMLLAAGEPSGAGGWALLIVAVLGVVTALLYRSMTKQLGKVPKSFESASTDPRATGSRRRPHVSRRRP